MVNFLVGAVLGFLSGLGVGGGSLLLLWMTLVIGASQSTARVMNLMFFIPSALAACFFRLKQGKLDIPKLLPSILAGCICAFLVSTFQVRLPQTLLKKLFGGLLLLTGIRELLYKPKAGQ
jgi:uncharacterized membrane protein YfcA